MTLGTYIIKILGIFLIIQFTILVPTSAPLSVSQSPSIYYRALLSHMYIILFICNIRLTINIINPIKYLCPFRYLNNSLSILRNKYLYNILIIIPLCQPTPQREHFDFLLLFLISVTCVHVLQITVNKKL